RFGPCRRNFCTFDGRKAPVASRVFNGEDGSLTLRRPIELLHQEFPLRFLPFGLLRLPPAWGLLWRTGLKNAVARVLESNLGSGRWRYAAKVFQGYFNQSHVFHAMSLSAILP